MECKHVRIKLSAYMDDELEASLHGRIAEHLKRCSECRGALEDLAGVDAVLRGLPRLTLPDDFARVVAAHAPGAPWMEMEPRRSFPARVWKALLDYGEKFMDLLEPEARMGTRSLDELNDIPACFIGHAYFKALGLQG